MMGPEVGQGIIGKSPQGSAVIPVPSLEMPWRRAVPWGKTPREAWGRGGVGAWGVHEGHVGIMGGHGGMRGMCRRVDEPVMYYIFTPKEVDIPIRLAIGSSVGLLSGGSSVWPYRPYPPRVLCGAIRVFVRLPSNWHPECGGTPFPLVLVAGCACAERLWSSGI